MFRIGDKVIVVGETKGTVECIPGKHKDTSEKLMKKTEMEKWYCVDKNDGVKGSGCTSVWATEEYEMKLINPSQTRTLESVIQQEVTLLGGSNGV